MHGIIYIRVITCTSHKTRKKIQNVEKSVKKLLIIKKEEVNFGEYNFKT